VKRGQQIIDNNGNYVSVIFGFNPGIGIGSGNVNFYPELSTIPMYGFRRNIGKHFNFETAIGIGYHWEFQTNELLDGKTKHTAERGTTVGFRIAFGYRF
jgi:hypothetical protein